MHKTNTTVYETVDTILNNYPKILDGNDPKYQDHQVHIACLYAKGVIFKDENGQYLISSDDLTNFKNNGYKTDKEISEIRNAKRLMINYLTLILSFMSFIISCITLIISKS